MKTPLLLGYSTTKSATAAAIFILIIFGRTSMADTNIRLTPDTSRELRVLDLPKHKVEPNNNEPSTDTAEYVARSRYRVPTRTRIKIQRTSPIKEYNPNLDTSRTISGQIIATADPIRVKTNIHPALINPQSSTDNNDGIGPTKTTTTSVAHKRPTYSRTRYNSNKETTKQKVDRFIAYFPVVQEKTVRLGQKVYKNEQASYSSRVRIWKELRQLNKRIMLVDNKCHFLQRNMSIYKSRQRKHFLEFNSFRQNQRQKTIQIEMHQASLDRQYFDIVEQAVNNSHSITEMRRMLDRLNPIVNEFARQRTRQDVLERQALAAIEAKSQAEISGIKKKLAIQANEITDLSERVMNEEKILLSHKQTMANSLTQHQKWIAESLNEQLDSQIKRMNSLELALSRHSEAFKGISGQMSDRDEELRLEKQKRVMVERTLDTAHRGVNDLKRNITIVENHITHVKNQMERSNNTVTRIDQKAEETKVGVGRNYARIQSNEQKVENIEDKLTEISNDMNEYKITMDESYDNLAKDLRNSVNQNYHSIKQIQEKLSRNERELREIRPDPLQLREFKDEEPSPPLITPQEIMSMIQESGFEEKMERLARIMRVHQIRLNNMTRTVQRVNEDTQSVTLTTEQYFSIINSQERVIREQNKTIGNMTAKINDQSELLRTLTSEIQHQQDTVIKLTNIVINLSQQLRIPQQLQRDCHDLFTSGHTSSGVYTITEGMGTRLVFCNMTETGGWTVIQRRVNGQEDFERNMFEYKKGFGDIFMDYWVGLDAIRKMTEFKVNTLRILLEDWQGNVRYASYSYFALGGPDYALVVRGYSGDAGDSLSSHNDQPFVVPQKDESNLWSHSECAVTRHAGWWFAPVNRGCGPSNLNGRFINSDISAVDHSHIHWRTWVGARLKSVSMQIIPTQTQPFVEQTLDTAPQDGMLVARKDPVTGERPEVLDYSSYNYLNEEDYSYVESGKQGSRNSPQNNFPHY